MNSPLCQDFTECAEAFCLANEKIASPNVLVYYDQSLSLQLAGDVRAWMGSVISQGWTRTSYYFCVSDTCSKRAKLPPGGKGGSFPDFWNEQISFIPMWMSFHFSDRP